MGVLLLHLIHYSWGSGGGGGYEKPIKGLERKDIRFSGQFLEEKKKISFFIFPFSP